MFFFTSRFVRGKLWAEELLDCILWYSVDTFFVDRVWKIPGFITFGWLKGVQYRLQKKAAHHLIAMRRSMLRYYFSISGRVRYAFGRRLSIPHSCGFGSRSRKRGTIPAHLRLCAGLSAAWPP